MARRGRGDVAAALGAALGGRVHDLRRLSGGASRITSAFDLEVDGTGAGVRRSLIVQTDRGDKAGGEARVPMERALLDAAMAAGVPVPSVVASGDGAHDGVGAAWLVVERLEGETIPRKILRDPEWGPARAALTDQCGRALAAIHTIDPDVIPGLPARDPLADPLPYLDLLREVRPALELGARWLGAHRPAPGPRVTVHGDFRLGNLLVGPEGLRGVLDWELAHAGDPAEDIGWLSAPAWRFGGPGEVGGLGTVPELLSAYEAAGGAPVDAARVHWWQVYATVKWATICALQASAHLSGATRSVELAAIGRRVCESEWDLFVLLGVAPSGPAPETPTGGAGTGTGAGSGAGAGASESVAGETAAVAPAPFGRPTAAELVEAVREYLETDVMEGSVDGARFEARVARNALGVVERELRLGPAIAAAHGARVRDLGMADDAALAAAVRVGEFDDDWHPVAAALAASARDQLLVAKPSYLPPATT
jgi:aminoglycoside phosphotransferase (APT) family kinase protein